MLFQKIFLFFKIHLSVDKIIKFNQMLFDCNTNELSIDEFNNMIQQI